MAAPTSYRTDLHAELCAFAANFGGYCGSLVSDLIVYLGSIHFVMLMPAPSIMHQNQQPQTAGF